MILDFYPVPLEQPTYSSQAFRDGRFYMYGAYQFGSLGPGSPVPRSWVLGSTENSVPIAR